MITSSHVVPTSTIIYAWIGRIACMYLILITLAAVLGIKPWKRKAQQWPPLEKSDTSALSSDEN